jgi:hypothetical protein
MPFSSSLIGEYENQQLPVIIYAVHNMLVRFANFRGLVIPSVFLLSIGLSFISVDVARLSWLLVGILTGPILQRYV